MIRFLSLALAFLAWALAPLSVLASSAEMVEVELPSRRVVTADFHRGKPGKPAVLLLHGFLQTRDFSTVAGVKDALATAGYTVLVPTLSLGISRRNRSLPCEAMHLHTLDEDVAEIEYWVDWLVRKGQPRIVLAGHSFGNLQLIAYLGRAPSPAVKKLLMISLTDVEVKQDARQRAMLAKVLKERVARGDRALTEIEFGNCRKYPGSPEALLSYLSISRQSILDALATLPVPALAIMGGKDDRMGTDWPEKLAARGIAVRRIPGASHFFDNQYEFDLQDAVLGSMPER